MPRSFVLGERFEAFIDAQVRSGRYNNANEVVRDALRLMEEQEKLRKLHAELQRLVEEGHDSDPSDEDGNPVLDRLHDKCRTTIMCRGE
jgi:antitoxin ParD1/3/4